MEKTMENDMENGLISGVTVNIRVTKGPFRVDTGFGMDIRKT